MLRRAFDTARACLEQLRSLTGSFGQYWASPEIGRKHTKARNSARKLTKHVPNKFRQYWKCLTQHYTELPC
eukprot:2677944-Alexandrium_andersonii.AAC.1